MKSDTNDWSDACDAPLTEEVRPGPILIVPDQKVQAVGYCLGYMLLPAAAAAMGRDDDARPASQSLLVSQVDFTELAEGRRKAAARLVPVSETRVPTFAVGMVKDRVTPWRSAFKSDTLSDTDVTFARTSGGHNAGIISEPGHPRRTCRVRHCRTGDLHVDPETWLEETPEREGAWWRSRGATGNHVFSKKSISKS